MNEKTTQPRELAAIDLDAMRTEFEAWSIAERERSSGHILNDAERAYLLRRLPGDRACYNYAPSEWPAFCGGYRAALTQQAAPTTQPITHLAPHLQQAYQASWASYCKGKNTGPGEPFAHGAGFMAGANAAQQTALEAPTAENIAAMIHYPQCWDTAAYPNVESALKEIINFKCTECGGKGQKRIHARPGSWRQCGACGGAGSASTGAAPEAKDRRIQFLEGLVRAYGPKSLQYDIEHPNDGLNAGAAPEAPATQQATPVAPVVAKNETRIHLWWRQDQAEWRECMPDADGAVEFVGFVPDDYKGAWNAPAPASPPEQAATQQAGAAVDPKCERCSDHGIIYVEDAQTPCPDCQDLSDYDGTPAATTASASIEALLEAHAAAAIAAHEHGEQAGYYDDLRNAEQAIRDACRAPAPNQEAAPLAANLRRVADLLGVLIGGDDGYVTAHAATILAQVAREVTGLRSLVDDLGAAQAAHAGAALTDEQIVEVLHSLGIDTYPSKYGFDAVQVSATSVPSIRQVVEKCAAIATSAQGKKS